MPSEHSTPADTHRGERRGVVGGEEGCKRCEEG